MNNNNKRGGGGRGAKCVKTREIVRNGSDDENEQWRFCFEVMQVECVRVLECECGGQFAWNV